MSYTKHNFKTGNILTAAQLNEMDDQIAANENATSEAVTALAGKVDSSDYNPEAQTAAMTQPVGKDGNGKLWTAPGSGSVTVESELSDSSTNPVQNKVLKRAIDSAVSRIAVLERAQQSGISDKVADALLALLRHVSYIDSSAKDLYQDLYDAITQTPSPDPDDPVTAVPDIFFSNDFEIVKKDGTYYSDEYGSNTFITPFVLEGKNYLTAYKSGQEYFFPIYPIPIPLGATQVTVSTSISNGEVMPGVFHWDGEKYVSDDNYGDTYPPLTGGSYTLDVRAYNDGFHCVSLCVRDVSQPDVFTYDASTWSVVFNRG